MKGLVVSAQVTAVAWACMAAVEPYGLLVNRQEVPSDVVSPVFSWMMRADREGACQSAYRIRLLGDGSTVWDSARRAGTLSVGQPYDGPPLADATEYEWELSVEDDLGEWSRPVRSRFSTTLTGTDAWKEMSFITPADRMPNKCAAASLVRRFVNGKSIRQAVWFTTGLGVYEAHVNGCLVDNRRMKPGFTDVRKCRAVFGCDVTGLIHCGVSETNVLAATVTSGWWSDEIIAFDKPGIHRPYAGKEVAFGGVLVIRYDDGSEERLYTDESWFGTWDGPISHASIFEGEHYDARKSRAWMIDGPDRAFSPVRINREFAGTIRPSVGAAVYQREDLALSPRAAYIWRDAEGGSSTNGIIVNHGRVKVIRRYGGNEECRLSRGETLVIDFGQNCSAVPDLIATAARGTELKIVFGEVLNEGNGAVSRHNDGPEGSVYRANLRGLAATGTQVRYIFSGAGDESYRTFFSVFGYRYASLTSTGDVVLKRIRSIPVSSVARGTEASTIETGVPALNAFVRNVMWSQYSNFLSVPTDCPQRDERLGWGCDARVFVPTACYNAESYAFYRKWLADLCDSQTAEGSFLSAAPIAQFGTETGRFGWSDAALFVANCIWRRYGDLTAIRESWRPMMRYFDYVERTRYTTPEAMVYQWADWLSFEKYETYDLEWGRYRYLNFVPKSRRMQLEVRPYWRYLGGCFRLWGARLMAEMAESLGEKRDASRCRTAAANALGDLRRDFLDPADGGLPRFLRGMQTPVLFALRLGLFDRPEAEAAARKSLVDGVIACGNHLTTGYLGTPLVLDVLSHEARAPEVAYTMLLQRTVPSWLYSVEHGATTVWERWNGYTEEAGYARPDMNSFNHYGLGSIVDWLYATMAGIREDVAAPGFKRFVLAPIPDRRIGFCKAKFRSPYGEIVSLWHYSDDGKWHWRFVIPANTTARVTNPLTGTTCECAAGSYDIEDLNK